MTTTQWLLWVDTREGRFTAEGDYNTAFGQLERQWRRAFNPKSRVPITTHYHVHTANVTDLGRYCTYCKSTPEGV